MLIRRKKRCERRYSADSYRYRKKRIVQLKKKYINLKIYLKMEKILRGVSLSQQQGYELCWAACLERSEQHRKIAQ